MQDNNYVAATKSYVVADRIAGYGLFGANISWSEVAGKPLDLNFNIRNIANKRYVIGGSDGSTSGLGLVSSFIGEPRMYTFGATYRF